MVSSPRVLICSEESTFVELPSQQSVHGRQPDSMRVVQQSPAWALHAYLRILGLDYSCENTPSSVALGLRLPLLVDSFEPKSEEVAMRHLARKCGSEMSAEAVFAGFLKQTLLTFEQVKRRTGVEKTASREALPFGLNVAVGLLLDVQEFFAGDRLDFLPGASDSELVGSLCLLYAALDEALLQKIASDRPPTLTKMGQGAGAGGLAAGASVGAGVGAGAGAGAADAVLFGHMAEVLCCSEQLADILLQHQGLMAFFHHVCALHFAVPYVHASANASAGQAPQGGDLRSWKSSLDVLVANPFLRGKYAPQLKACLTQGALITHIAPISRTGLDMGGDMMGGVGGTDLGDMRELSDRPCSEGDWAVLDAPTARCRVQLSLSLSSLLPWTTKVEGGAGIGAGVGAGAGAGAGMAASGDSLDSVYTMTSNPMSAQVVVGAGGAGTETDAKTGTETEIGIEVSTVSLGGLAFLLVVGACFAGYAGQA